jgi:DnaJ-class molecular chaperone
MSCETCSGKGYIHTRRHPDDKDHVERCDECYQEGRVSWTDEQAAEYARRRSLRQAIRATHYGTMGDPMNPTTRP